MMMRTLTILQQITPPHDTTIPTPWPQTNPIPHHHNRLPPPRTRRLIAGAKGFTGNKEPIAKIEKKKNNSDGEDDKIADEVWGKMIKRILAYTGVPLAIGLGLLQFFSVLKERELWNVPIWVPLITTFITFGASALGIAYGSLSTSLDPNEQGSLMGFEQVEKNWVEMWEEEEEEEKN